MFAPNHPLIQVARPTPLAACLAAAFAITATSAFAAPYAPELGPLPAAKAAGVARARAMPKSTRAPMNIMVFNCTDGGIGSLRLAIGSAVSGDTIDLSQLACSTITLTSGALAVSVNDLTLRGSAYHRVTIDGGFSSGHFNNAIAHYGSGILKLNDLTVTDAKYTDGSGLGGCIWSDGSVYLLNSTVTHCFVTNTTATGNASGAGIWASGNFQAIASQVTDNTATSENANALGGGIYAKLDGAVLMSTLSGNHASGGGSTSEGGGIFVEGNLSMFQSTLSGNYARFGGGLFLDGRNSSGTPLIENSTISGNSAHQVGGIFARIGSIFYNDTILFNTETASAGAGLYVEQNSTVESTIIALNTANGNEFDLAGADGVTVLGGHDMITAFAVSQGGIYIPGDPSYFGPLADNGGPTLTHALKPAAGPAFGAGSNLPGNPYDQRGPGFQRSFGSSTDMGAFEFNPDIIFVNGFN